MELTTVWFILIAVLWIGYFVLEGFDFGVGALLPVLGRDDGELSGETRRRQMLSSIGPFWDGNEDSIYRRRVSPVCRTASVSVPASVSSRPRTGSRVPTP